jgi:hypothetical protein
MRSLALRWARGRSIVWRTKSSRSDSATSWISASLLGHVIVERRDIDADPIGDVAGAQTLDALFDDEGPRGGGDGGAPILGRGTGGGESFRHGAG